MADETIDTTVAGASTTPAPAEPVVTTPTPDQPGNEGDEQRTETDVFERNSADDAWDFSKGGDEQPKDDTEPPAKPADERSGDERKDEKSDQAEPTEEQKSLEELFGAEKPGDDKTEPDPTAAELEKMPPEELIERQKNKYARDWASRNAEKAEIIKDFQFGTKPIEEVAARFEQINSDRFGEFSQYAAHKLVDANPDATFKRAYAVKMLQQDPTWQGEIPSLEDIIAGKVGQTVPDAAPAGEIPADIAALTKDLDASLGFDWRDPNNDAEFLDDRELALAKTARSLEAAAKAAAAEKSRLEEQLRTTTEANRSTENADLKIALDQSINDYRTSIDNEIRQHVFRSAGLEVSDSDTPEIAAFKRSRQEWYVGKGNEESRFEKFATEESSVKASLEAVWTRIIDAQLQEQIAAKAGDTAKAAEHRKAAEAEKYGVITLLAQANREFKEKILKPDLDLIGKLSGKLAEPIRQAQARVEVVANGSGDATNAPRPREYESADDVWDSMPAEEARRASV